MRQQRGVVLILTLIILMMLTLLSLSYFEQALWLQKLRQQIKFSRQLQQSVDKLIPQLEHKPLPHKCIQSAQLNNFFDHWQASNWHAHKRCHEVIEGININYILELMPASCWYFVWGVELPAVGLQQQPVSVYRVTLQAKRQSSPFSLTELYIARLDRSGQNCPKFSHNITLGLQSRRHRLGSDL